MFRSTLKFPIIHRHQLTVTRYRFLRLLHFSSSILPWQLSIPFCVCKLMWLPICAFIDVIVVAEKLNDNENHTFWHWKVWSIVFVSLTIGNWISLSVEEFIENWTNGAVFTYFHHSFLKISSINCVFQKLLICEIVVV